VCLSRITRPLTFFSPTAHPRLGLNEHIESPKAYTNRLVLVYGIGGGEAEAKTQTDGITEISKIAKKIMNKPRWLKTLKKQPPMCSFRMVVKLYLGLF
jgi:hypothetical protein